MTARTKKAQMAILKKRQGRISAQIKALEGDEEDIDAEEDELDAEGDEEDIDAEEDELDAEGDEEDVDAEEDEDPKAEGDEEDGEDGEDDEEQTQMRIAAFQSLPEAKGRKAQATELAKSSVTMKAAKRILKAGARTDRAAARTDTPLNRASVGASSRPASGALASAVEKVNAKSRKRRGVS